MEYNYLDSEYYLLKSPYMSLMKPRAGTHFIEAEAKKIRAYSKVISQFPDTKCEPLEFLYLCHESLCAIDKLLFEDLINFGWRGIVWASWLAAITPFPEKYMQEKLSLIIDEVPHNSWIVELALLSLSNTSEENYVLLEPIYEIKEALTLFPYTKLPLRKWPSDKYFTQKQKERKKILSIYKKQGANVALEAIETLPKIALDLPYKAWLLIHDKI